MLRGVDVRGTQVRHQQLLPAEHVQRQVAVAVVVPVEEAALLSAVHGVVGGVEVQDQLGRRRVAERLDEQLDQQPGQLDAGAASDAVLQPAQRRRRRQRTSLVGVPFAGRLHQRVDPQAVVVVEVFRPAGDAEHALGEHGPLVVLDHRRVTRVGHAGGHPPEQPAPARRLAEQQCPGVGGDLPAVELRQQFPVAQWCKSDRLRVTVCSHGPASLLGFKSLLTPESTRGRAVAL